MADGCLTSRDKAKVDLFEILSGALGLLCHCKPFVHKPFSAISFFFLRLFRRFYVSLSPL